MRSEPTVHVPTTRVVQVLWAVAGFLVLTSLAGGVSTHFLGHDTVKGLVPRFNLDYQASVGTWFSSLLLLGGAVLSGLIARATHEVGEGPDPPPRLAWLGLGGLLLAGSLDETAEIHDMLTLPLREGLGLGGWLYMSWVVVGAVVAAAIVAVFARLFRRVPRPVGCRLLAAAALFFGGAIGMEIVDGRYAALHGMDTFGYWVLTTLEEGLEMAGLVLLNHALLVQLRRVGGRATVAVEA